MYVCVPKYFYNKSISLYLNILTLGDYWLLLLRSETMSVELCVLQMMRE
jgi:hypothetical protein